MPKKPITVTGPVEARKTLPEILRRFRKEGTIADPVVVGTNHKPEAVLLPYGQWERMANLIEDPEIATIIAERQAREISEMFEIPIEIARVVADHADQNKPLSNRHIEQIMADLQIEQQTQRQAQLAAIDTLQSLDLDVTPGDQFVAAALTAANAVPAAELDRVLTEATEQLREDLRSNLDQYTREQALASVLADFERTHGAFTDEERRKASRLFDQAREAGATEQPAAPDQTSATQDPTPNTEVAMRKESSTPTDGDIEASYPEEDREAMEELEGNPG